LTFAVVASPALPKASGTTKEQQVAAARKAIALSGIDFWFLQPEGRGGDKEWSNELTLSTTEAGRRMLAPGWIAQGFCRVLSTALQDKVISITNAHVKQVVRPGKIWIQVGHGEETCDLTVDGIDPNATDQIARNIRTRSYDAGPEVRARIVGTGMAPMENGERISVILLESKLTCPSYCPSPPKVLTPTPSAAAAQAKPGIPLAQARLPVASVIVEQSPAAISAERIFSSRVASFHPGGADTLLVSFTSASCKEYKKTFLLSGEVRTFTGKVVAEMNTMTCIGNSRLGYDCRLFGKATGRWQLFVGGKQFVHDKGYAMESHGIDDWNAYVDVITSEEGVGLAYRLTNANSDSGFECVRE
jgi:hypothetical protein